MSVPPVSRRETFALAAAPAVLSNKARAAGLSSRTVNVVDFGAKGDGVTDDTEAFNRATQADVEWSWDLLGAILVPSGKYRIGGTVFLRKGQSLIGEGLSTYIDASGAKESTFVMGRRRDGRKGRGVEDPGGLPVRIESLMGLGGAADQGFIFASIPGFQINALFLTAVGLGIEIEGADGIVSDVEIDQSLTGILLRNSQNVVLSNLNLYLANYGVTFADRCRDIAISNSLFCYTKYAAILLGDGGRENNSISITGCVFTNNIAYSTFEGYIYARSSASDLLLSGCSFRNAPSYAINQGAGTDLSLSVQGCVFDGSRTNAVYDQSPTPKGLHLRHGQFLVSNCTFRRLPSEIVRVTGGAGALNLEGGSVDGAVKDAIVVSNGDNWSLAIRHVAGIAAVTSGTGGHRLLLPWLGARTVWQVTVYAGGGLAPSGVAHLLVTDGRVEPIWSSMGSGQADSGALHRALPRPSLEGGQLALGLPAAVFGTAQPRVEAVGLA